MNVARVPFTAGPDLSVGMSVHKFLVPSTPPAAGIALSVEIPVTLFPWTTLLIGYVMHATKFAASVRHRGPIDWAILEKSDVGLGIADISVVPGDVLIAVRPFTSVRKVIVSASTVKAEGKAMACTHLVFPFVFLTCADLPLPQLPGPTNMLNLLRLDVQIGVTLEDLIKGYVLTAIDVAVHYGLEHLLHHAGGHSEHHETPRQPSLREVAGHTAEDRLARHEAHRAEGLAEAIWELGHRLWMGEDPAFEYETELGPLTVAYEYEGGQESEHTVVIGNRGPMASGPLVGERVVFDADGSPRLETLVGEHHRPEGHGSAGHAAEDADEL